MSLKSLLIAALFVWLVGFVAVPLFSQELRIATFNTSMFRQRANELVKELQSPDSIQPKKIAEILQIVRPDIVLLNEFDYDEKGKAISAFMKNYLEKSQNGNQPIQFKYRFAPPVNTGIPTKFDLDKDGKTGGPGDAFGFGKYPGQYGFVVLSKFPIDSKLTRTFQKFLWKDMPRALLPKNVEASNASKEVGFYSERELQQFRLSSKNHCDVVIRIGDLSLHFLVSHPTPPVFDKSEDRNGRRNHDEIRFWNDYISSPKSEYIYDDRNRKGGLNSGDRFIIAGDLNADPADGDSTGNPISLFKKNSKINFGILPKSIGSADASKIGRANKKHKGDARSDTADFNDETVGNLRIDYVLPSANLLVKSSGVFWPKANSSAAKLIDATDHRLVWLNIVMKQ